MPLAGISEVLAKPQLEIGVAGAGISSAAYPSSSVTSNRGFIVPWFVYRSEKVQVKDGGVKLIAYQNDWLTVDVGIGGSLNADTSITPIREGMPDIDFIFEAGPRFDVSIKDDSTGAWRDRVNWVTAYRFAVSTDFKRLDYRGPLLNTELVYRKDGIGDNRLSFDVSLGATWAEERLQDYFFEVAPEFVTSDRARFDAQAGFLGLDLSAGIQFQPTKRVSAFVGVGVSSFDGSRNEDSPLFEEDLNTRVIAALSWEIYRSKKLVTASGE